jgi:hypothetical protein
MAHLFAEQKIASVFQTKAIHAQQGRSVVETLAQLQKKLRRKPEPCREMGNMK